MEISVKYFASMRDLMGKTSESVEIADKATALDLWAAVSDLDIPENTLIAINMEYTQASQILNDGDEVGFFPPVTGG